MLGVQKEGLHSCYPIKKNPIKTTSQTKQKQPPKQNTEKKTKTKKQNLGLVKGKSLIHSSSFCTKRELLAKAEALEMYVQPDIALRTQCWTYYVAAEFIVSLLQPGIKNYYKHNFLKLRNTLNITPG